jgi:heparanase
MRIDPAELRPLGTVDERFQSYNVEMAEVIGADFWKPYGTDTDAILQHQRTSASGSTPVGVDAALFQKRPPVNLVDSRLRRLAAALGPAYVRVSGTWANTVYFHDSSAPAPASPPSGFAGVLTGEQWTGVVEFAAAVDAKLVTSFSTGRGVRDAQGLWTAAQARRFLAATEAAGGKIAGAEFMNEPTFAAMGGAPDGYDAAAYGRDIAVFDRFLEQAAPETTFLGPGSVGEPGWLTLPGATLASEDLLAACGPVFDAFSYHFYGAISKRGAALAPQAMTTAEAALSEEWLARTEVTEGFYAGLRDRFEPTRPLWVTETADAAAGGNPWASSFLDSFRYIEQLGRLAKRGVQVVIHNTLASSDYGLLDEQTLTPRPNYWAALLWRRLVGTTVLDTGRPPEPNLHLYAHSLRGHREGIALIVANTDRTVTGELIVPTASERYTLSAHELLATSVELNGAQLKLDANGELPPLAGHPTPAGQVSIPPASITFLAVPRDPDAVAGLKCRN